MIVINMVRGMVGTYLICNVLKLKIEFDLVVYIHPQGVCDSTLPGNDGNYIMSFGYSTWAPKFLVS